MIPGVATYHRRESWVDRRYPILGPAANMAAVDTAVIHYTGADDLIDGDPGEHAENLPAYFRAMQRNYVDSRGYSLGYWFGVDWLGGVWQVRGWEYRSAANAGHNLSTCPILVLVDGNDMATAAAVRSVQAIIAEGQRRSSKAWRIVGHGQLKGAATACPGVGLRAQITAGVFVPSFLPPAPPPPAPTIGGHSVFLKLIRLDGTLAVYAQYTGGYKTWVPNNEVRKVYESVSGLGVEVVTSHDLFRATGPILGPKPAGVDDFGIPA